MGEWSIRRELLIETPLDAVWTCVVTPALLSRWWCPPPSVEVMFEQREGSHYVEHYHDTVHAYDVDGTVVAYRPLQQLTIRRVTKGFPSPADLIDITLRDEDGHTRVVINHSFEHLSENRRKDMDEYFAGRWSSALQRLRRIAATTGERT